MTLLTGAGLTAGLFTWIGAAATGAGLIARAPAAGVRSDSAAIVVAIGIAAAVAGAAAFARRDLAGT